MAVKCHVCLGLTRERTILAIGRFRRLKTGHFGIVLTPHCMFPFSHNYGAYAGGGVMLEIRGRWKETPLRRSFVIQGRWKEKPLRRSLIQNQSR